jgi:hypothetical protein
VSALTQGSALQMRHSTLAWSCAVAISAAALGAQFDFESVSLAACAFLAIAAAVWSVKWLARRLARALPADATPGAATLQASAWLGVLALCLWTAAFLVTSFVMVYPEPAMNRAYAESLGVELGPFFSAALGACMAITLVAVPIIRALRDPAPGASAALRAFCLAAPLACLLLAMAPYTYFPGWSSAWASRGADLPDPILFFRAAEAYWGVPPALALAISCLAWAGRSRAVVFTRSVFAQLLLLMLCSALLSLAAMAVWLPLFSICSAI